MCWRSTNLRNLRVAETEKFAHVTYFFNGGIEVPFPGEDRALIPSLKVATYDLAPEMKAEAIGDAIVKAVNDTAFDLVVANFANADMVGHSGKLEPTIKACEAVDAQLGRIYKAIKEKNGSWLITADHGNAETDGGPGDRRTAHGAHDQSGADDLRGGRWAALSAARGWIAAGYFADAAEPAEAGTAEGDDGRGSAGADREVSGSFSGENGKA